MRGPRPGILLGVDGHGEVTDTSGETVSDGDLLDRMARGDGAALGTLYDRHAAAAMAVAVRILGDPAEAEDVIQNVFVRIWRQAGRYDGTRGAVAAWLLTSVRNEGIDRLRRRESRLAATRNLPASTQVSAEAPGAGEERKRVRDAIAALPSDQREAIELAYFEGRTQTEIAGRLGQPLGTVKTRIRLAMEKIRSALMGPPREPA